MVKTGDEIEKALKVISDTCRKHLDKPSPCLDCPLCYLYDYEGHCLFSQCWPEKYEKEYKKLLKEKEEE